MTPAETLARKRCEAETLIRQSAPASAHAELTALLRSALVLRSTPTSDTQIALGASKFGGAPDVPEGFEWPQWKGKSLAFLAQINLSEIAPFDLEEQLPRTGVLLFFASLDEENPVWGEPDQREGWRVLWAHAPLHRTTPPADSHIKRSSRIGSISSQRVKPPADSHWIVPQNTQRVAFDVDWIFDTWMEHTLVENPDWGEEAWEEFEFDIMDQAPHRMLTCPYGPQLSPFVVAANAAQGKSGFALYDESVATDDWVLLLQLDTGAGNFFADLDDVGWLYFMIRRDDLADGDFSKVWFNDQCT